jgi:hypothetical protein
MIAASEALSAIDRAIGDIRNDESKLSEVLRGLSDEIARLRGREADAFRTLARVRLDAIARDRELSELDATERRARQLIERHRERLARMAADRAELMDQRARALGLRDDKVRAFEAATNAVEDRRAATEARMAVDPVHLQADRTVAEAEAVAAKAAAKAETAETDRIAKGKPYENDPLFMYLWERKFGTAGYDAGPFVRFFDRKVAQLVGYDAARPNYAMLLQIPQRLREHADQQREAVAEVIALRADLERKALEADGIVALERAMEAAKQALDAAEATLKAVEDKIAALDQTEAEMLTSGADPAYREAVDLVAQSLTRESLQTLLREALATPTPEDERAVRDIGDTRKKIADLETEVTRQREAVRSVAERRTKLEQSRDQFRRSGYDDPFGSFSNDQTISRVLSGIVAGVIDAMDLDDALRSGYRRNRRSGQSFGGGIRFPSGGTWGSGNSGSWGGGGGSWGSGGGSGGGGGGGGGFKTGGGF